MHIICVIGQTGVGKTDASLAIAQSMDGEIINLDMGQMYKPIGIGTAKPLEWEKSTVRHHCFDLVNKPESFSVFAYRKKVDDILKDIERRGKNAVFVGGSLFYLKSLLFSFGGEKEKAVDKKAHNDNDNDNDYENINWQDLYAIDPERAAEIHPKDAYRIKRALAIWNEQGIKPSLCKPCIDPVRENISFLWLLREKTDLEKRIEARVSEMLGKGWLEEVQALDEDWKHFVHKKKLCGYDVVVDAVRQNKTKLDEKEIYQIIKDTLLYAKKQRAFWASLKKQYCIDAEKSNAVHELNLTFNSIDLYIDKVIVSKGLLSGKI